MMIYYENNKNVVIKAVEKKKENEDWLCTKK